MKTYFRFIVILLLTAVAVVSTGLLFGCSCGGGGEYVYNAEDFSLNYESKTIKVGESFILTVDNAKYKDSVSFETENADVAIVSAKGVVTGVSVGQATVTVTVGDKEKTCVVTVLEGNFGGENGYTVVLNYSRLTLVVGENKTIKATVYFGSEITEDKTVTWESSDPDVLGIETDENDGNAVKITAERRAGEEPPYTAEVIATADKFTAKCVVTVTEKIDVLFDVETDEGTLTACRDIRLPLFAENAATLRVYKNDEQVQGANVTVTSSDSDVAAIEGGKIIGKAIGECYISATFEGYESRLYVVVYDRIIQTEYEKRFVKADESVTVDLGEVMADGVPISLTAADVTKVLNAADRSEITIEKDVANNKITLDQAETPNGDNEYYICAATAKYSVRIKTITRLIGSAVDFNAFMGDVNGCLPSNAAANTFYYFDGYYEMTSDVDFAGAAPTANYYWCVFSGVFDGCGHAIKNVSSKNPFFSVLKGTVKNTAFIDVSVSAQYAGGICSELTGTVENCYVSGTVNGSSAQGGICQAVRTAGVIKNCVVEVSITGAGGKGTVSYSNGGNISNVYGICAEVQRCDASSGAEIAKVGMYETRGEFIAEVTGLPAANGWGAVWDLENGKLYFGGKNLFVSVVDKTAQGSVYDMSLQSDENYEWDLTALGANIGNVTSVRIAGQAVTGFTRNGNVLSIPNGEIKGVMAGGYKLTEMVTDAAGNDETYKFYVTVITDGIANKAQFNAFMQRINNGVTDGYYVLTADIDYAGGAPTANIYGKTFAGWLDGRGHAIKNITASSPLFWILKGTVKDVAFINVSVTAQYAGGICSELTGTVENCYVSGTLSGSTAQGGICQAVRASGVIKNCIVEVSITGAGTKGTVSYSNVGNISSVYGICAEIQRRDASSGADIAAAGMYATRGEFTAAVTELPAASGWGAVWNIENGNLYFNGTNLYDAQSAPVQPQSRNYNLYPSVVNDYLELTDENEIAEYLYTHRSDWQTPEFVKPVILNWQGTGAEYKVVIAYDDKYENVARIIDTTSNTVAVYNLVPDRYYYKITAKDETLIASDYFDVDGELRMIYLGNTNMNIRDEGGYTGEFGKVRYELLYRSADITVLSSGGTAVGILVDELGIKTEIDLRLSIDDNLTGKESPSESITRYNLGIRQMDYMFPNLNSGRPFQQQYADNLREIMLLLGDESNYPIVFHCSAGADRTGTVAMLVGGLLGLDYDALVKDFEITSFYKGRRWRSAINEENGVYSFDESGVMEDDSGNIVSFDKVYRHILSTYGTGDGKFSTAVENYMKSVIGLKTKDIENIRKILIEDYVESVPDDPQSAENSTGYNSDEYDNAFDLGNE